MTAITGMPDRLGRNAHVAALSEPAAYRLLREAARATVVSGYDLYAKCLPEQLRLLEGACGTSRPGI